jgi:hypothetical protein
MMSPEALFMRLESLAIRLLHTITDGATCRINPLDFTALLYLRDRGFANVSVKDGYVVAERTAEGKQFAIERARGGALTKVSNEASER